MDKDKIWKSILDHLRSELSPTNFSYFKQTSISEITQSSIILSVPTQFFAETLRQKFLLQINQAIYQILEQNLAVEFIIDSSKLTKGSFETEDEEDLFSIPMYTSASIPATPLNTKYTLDSFVVGLSNNLAFAAAQAVVANPGISYNPLFIYGHSGVGKTHLMQAIGNELFRKNPHLKILYAPSEKFMNDFVESIQTKQMGAFRSKYRNCDLFLIDDVQFISGRDAMQEEFFHTFNEIYSKSLQIILTSDKPPGEIQKLEPRLVSRLQGGLMVDIQLPDFDTRMAIIKSKLLEKNDDLPEDILRFIAETTASNTRELEGKITQVLSLKFQGQPVTLDMAKAKLGQSTIKTTRLDYKKVISEINQYFNVKTTDLTGPRRQKELVLPRQIAMFLLYNECKLPLEKVGQILGGRDHTTIMHGVKKIEEAQDRDREVQNILGELMQQLI